MKSVSLDTLSQQITDGDVKKLNLILRADVNGSLEALILSINQIKTSEVSINILHSATGSINENDILLAKTSDAVVIGFRVNATKDALASSERDNIDIRTYDIIYEIISDIEKVISGLYNKVLVETKIGAAEVREIFKFSKSEPLQGLM